MRVFASYFLAWFPMLALAIGNGVLRDLGYGKRMSELCAHQLSSVLGGLVFLLYGALAARFIPLDSAAQAQGVGAMWLAMTVLFEFGFGRLVGKHSWRRLLADYNLLAGRLWPLVLACVALGPWVGLAVIN